MLGPIDRHVLMAVLLASCGLMARLAHAAEAPIDLGDRRELFVDNHLIDQMQNVSRQLHAPRDEGPVLQFDQPWEGIHCGYCTLLQDGAQFRVYYRGMPAGAIDGTEAEVTCVAVSDDGIHWTKPQLGIYEAAGSKQNNIVYAGDPPFSHNFSPLLDPRPDCPPDQRYKALSGLDSSGLVALVSADGLHWQKLRSTPVIPRQAPFPFAWMFDSQNVAFWSEAEQQFVCYFRVYVGVRRIARCVSKDFMKWSDPVLMENQTHGTPSPLGELYTNQTLPYFRAPPLYLAVAVLVVP